MAKDRVNLLLDRDAVARARRYSELHGTSISSVVSELLAALPIEGDDDGGPSDLTPTVRRLLGLVPARVSRQDYRDHLVRKHRR